MRFVDLRWSTSPKYGTRSAPAPTMRGTECRDPLPGIRDPGDLPAVPRAMLSKNSAAPTGTRSGSPARSAARAAASASRTTGSSPAAASRSRRSPPAAARELVGRQRLVRRQRRDLRLDVEAHVVLRARRVSANTPTAAASASVDRPLLRLRRRIRDCRIDPAEVVALQLGERQRADRRPLFLQACAVGSARDVGIQDTDRG
jgi:hypothetical protein